MKKKNKFPITINKYNWYYKNRASIDLVHEVYDKNNIYIKTDIIRIPLKKLKIIYEIS